MNFLAHLYLAAPEKDLITGGFLGDFVKGPLRGHFDQGIEMGIQLHRHIDGLTDRHPAQQRIKQILPKHFSRFSGIVSDMMCDHFLSTNWSDFHSTPLIAFNQQCLLSLEEEQHQLPDQAHKVLKRMHSGEWLLNYHRLDYVSGALTRIGQRIRFANPLNECSAVLPTVRDQLEVDCLEILYDTREAVREWRAKNFPERIL